ncbi:hypothetical protein ACFQPF_17415 [Fictibacillus iocasae]|uniref:DUF5081 domain-containing protein n=1 Tax=Fictibacillus iocasae TaxID=2715437 RepID=A0ABW2NU70_9BACL
MSYSLSAEEYILSLILVGGESAAYGIKEEVFGNVSDDELETRMDSALYGLLSKGLLYFENNEEMIEPAFQSFLLSLTNVPRVIRCQTAQGNELVTTSLFFAEDLTVQQSRYQNRVYQLYRENDENQISAQLGISTLLQPGEPVYIEDTQFERMIDQLMQQQELDELTASLLPDDVMHVLKDNGGKLNMFYDYRFTPEGTSLHSFLYATSHNRTYKMEEKNGKIKIEPFSSQTFFQTV